MFTDVHRCSQMFTVIFDQVHSHGASSRERNYRHAVHELDIAHLQNKAHLVLCSRLLSFSDHREWHSPPSQNTTDSNHTLHCIASQCRHCSCIADQTFYQCYLLLKILQAPASNSTRRFLLLYSSQSNVK